MELCLQLGGQNCSNILDANSRCMGISILFSLDSFYTSALIDGQTALVLHRASDDVNMDTAMFGLYRSSISVFFDGQISTIHALMQEQRPDSKVNYQVSEVMF